MTTIPKCRVVHSRHGLLEALLALDGQIQGNHPVPPGQWGVSGHGAGTGQHVLSAIEFMPGITAKLIIQQHGCR